MVQDRAGAGPTYTASYLEVGRQLMTDPAFRQRWEQRGQAIIEDIRDRLRAERDDGRTRSDLPLDDIVTYTVITLDGLMLQLRLGTPMHDLTTAIDLYEQALRPL